MTKHLTPVPPLILDDTDRPRVVINDRDLHELEIELTKHIRERNDLGGDPLVYIRNGRLVEVDPGLDGEAPSVRDMTASAFRSRVVAMIEAVKVTKDNKGNWSTTAAKPTLDDLSGLYDRAHALGVPQLKQVTMCPLFDNDGHYHDRPGYVPETSSYYAPGPGLLLPQVPENPTSDEVQAALQLLREELLGDFLLTNPEGDMAALLGVMLTPMVTQLINGPRPLYVLDAPSAGSGKTKLARMVTGHAIGDAALPTAPTTSEEWAKALVSQARKGRAVMIFDNVNDVVDSGTFAAAVTSYPAWEGRILGTSDNIELASPAAWVITGNGMTMSAEMSRRSMIIRIEPHPRDFTAWRHKDLDRWAIHNRGNIQAALATLVRAWIVAGMPDGQAVLPSFEAWCRVIDGILRNAGVEGLMHGREEQVTEVDDETQQWAQFAFAFMQLVEIGEIRAEGVTAGELIKILREQHTKAIAELPLGIDHFTTARSLGKRLSGKRGAVLAVDTEGRNLKLVREMMRNAVSRYRIVAMGT